jgi:alpha-ketoglutarate-dependent taurine dioxygenase
MLVLSAEPGAVLPDIDDAIVERSFREHGLILFRGYRAGPVEFDALAQRFTAEHFIGYGRAPFASHPAITTVNESRHPLEPHTDNGIRPQAQRPDITWFLCETPAESGGETTVFDGIEIWKRLSSPVQSLLLEKPIRFSIRYAEQTWRAMSHPDLSSFRVFIEEKLGGKMAAVHADGTVEVEILSPAVQRTRFNGELAFVSSMMLAGSKSFEAMSVGWEGGELPQAVRDEVTRALAECCELIRWEAGDVAMLDNTRFLHGRREFSDPRRRLYLIQTLRSTLP